MTNAPALSFSPADPTTWPVVMSLEEVAAVYRRTPEAIRHALKPQRGRVPHVALPFLNHPMRWRKADVLRHVQGARTVAVTR